MLGSAGLLGSGAPVVRTFLFTDIVRSTDLIEAIGDEAWENVLAWHDRTLNRALEAHGSLHVEHRGDGFFAVFADAGTAVSCALEIQGTLAAHRRTEGFAPSVRIGIHAAAARLVEGKYAGQGVHAAARIGSLAGPGEILASLSTVAQLPEVRYGAARSERLKGLRDAVTVVAVLSAPSNGA
jgi:class 3 adenylate cyclase